jgi:ADP-ribosyl-[dinitrogen reductase] hydrolase
LKNLDKVLGGLFGVACGDALGATLEFSSVEDGFNKYGYLKDIVGGGPFDVKPGEITDDTEMTIAVAKGILEEPTMPWKTIGSYFVKWYESKPKDIGNITRMAIEEYSACKDWGEAAYRTDKKLSGKTGGNGSLMRCIPVGLYYDDINKVKSISKIQSGLTHYAKEAALACELYSTLVYEYLRNPSKMGVIEKTLDNYPIYSNVFYMKKEELKPTGYVVDTLRCALWCFMNTTDFETAVCEAVNLCGDSDTIGAITGGLAGVFYGYDAIPDRWKDKIIIKQELMELARNIYDRKESKEESKKENENASEKVIKRERFKPNEVTGIDIFVGDSSTRTSANVKVSFEKGRAFYNNFGENTIELEEEATELSSKAMDDLKSELSKIGVQFWSRNYTNNNNEAVKIHWSIKVRVGRKSYQCLGEDDFPENWKQFCKCIGKLVGHNLG